MNQCQKCWISLVLLASPPLLVISEAVFGNFEGFVGTNVGTVLFPICSPGALLMLTGA